MPFVNDNSRLTAEQIEARKARITKGMIMTMDVGGPVMVVESRGASRIESPLAEAARRMTKARELAEQLGAALRGRRHG